MDRVRREVQRLAPGQRLRLVSSWRWLLVCQHVAAVPYPIKLGISQTLALFVMLAIMPPIHVTLFVLLVIWAGSYCLGFGFCSMLPRRRRSWPALPVPRETYE